MVHCLCISTLLRVCMSYDVFSGTAEMKIDIGDFEVFDECDEA